MAETFIPVVTVKESSRTSKVEPTIPILQKRLDEIHSMLMHPHCDLAEPIKNECHHLCMDAHTALVECELKYNPTATVPEQGTDMSPRQEAKQKALTNAKLRKSWQKFLKKCQASLSPEEAALLSLPTIKEMMHHYQLDRNPVEMANVELYWRALAQQREDDRVQAALAHKKCAATSDSSKKPPGRVMAESMSPIRK